MSDFLEESRIRQKMKRRRQCENENEKNDGNEDRLSDLPDNILLHILSFLNTKHVVQTCVLSTRWKHLWKHIPTLMLHDSRFSSDQHFAIFVSKILTLRDTSNALHSLDLGHYGNIKSQLLKKILKYVCSHNTHLRKLGISVCGDSGLIMNCVSQCQALTSLKLSNPRGNSNPGILFPKSLNLPALTNLDLKNFIFCGGENECAEPFSAFTKLNSLVIRHCKIKDAQVLSISSETLDNLALHYNSLRFSKIELSAPSLCTLSFTGDIIEKTCRSRLSSIKQVNINSVSFSYSTVRPLVILSWLQDLSNVESLKVTSSTLQILSLVPDLLEIKIPSLCNLKSLEVELMHFNSFLINMEEAMLEKAVAKSPKEATKLRKAFETGQLKLSPIPDGIVDFLRQNSPSAKVNIRTCYPSRFNLKQIEESIKGAKIINIKQRSQFLVPASSFTAAESTSAAAPDFSTVAPPNFDLYCAEKDDASSNVEMP